MVFIICYWFFTKYVWVDLFKVVFTHSTKKPNKIWADQDSEFYNFLKKSFKKWVKDNDIEIYSIYNEGKSTVAEIFPSILTDKIYKYMAAVSKNACFDVLNDIIGKYNM